MPVYILIQDRRVIFGGAACSLTGCAFQALSIVTRFKAIALVQP